MLLPNKPIPNLGILLSNLTLNKRPNAFIKYPSPSVEDNPSEIPFIIEVPKSSQFILLIVSPIKLNILVIADVIPLAKFSTLPSSTAPLIASAMSVDKVSVSMSPIVWNIVANKFSIADTALLNLELSIP